MNSRTALPRIFLILSAFALLPACSDSDGGPGSPTLQAITVTPLTPAIANGTLQQFTATGTYSDGSSEDMTALVTWDSSDPLVATFGAVPGTEGRATAQGVGSAVITATDPSGQFSDWTTLSVTSASLVGLTVTPVNPGVPGGFTQQFTATGTFDDASVQDLTAWVTWSSVGFTTISNDPGTEGLASTTSFTETATITAEDPTATYSDSTSLFVFAPILIAIEIWPVDPTVAAGDFLQLQGIGIYSDQTMIDNTPNYTWGSSDYTVAQVDNGGNPGLTAGISEGTVTIMVVDPVTGIGATAELTVTPP